MELGRAAAGLFTFRRLPGCFAAVDGAVDGAEEDSSVFLLLFLFFSFLFLPAAGLADATARRLSDTATLVNQMAPGLRTAACEPVPEPNAHFLQAVLSLPAVEVVKDVLVSFELIKKLPQELNGISPFRDHRVGIIPRARARTSSFAPRGAVVLILVAEVPHEAVFGLSDVDEAGCVGRTVVVCAATLFASSTVRVSCLCSRLESGKHGSDSGSLLLVNADEPQGEPRIAEKHHWQAAPDGVGGVKAAGRPIVRRPAVIRPGWSRTHQ
jgi:hypothetical protein